MNARLRRGETERRQRLMHRGGTCAKCGTRIGGDHDGRGQRVAPANGACEQHGVGRHREPGSARRVECERAQHGVPQRIRGRTEIGESRNGAVELLTQSLALGIDDAPHHRRDVHAKQRDLARIGQRNVDGRVARCEMPVIAPIERRGGMELRTLHRLGCIATARKAADAAERHTAAVAQTREEVDAIAVHAQLE